MRININNHRMNDLEEMFERIREHNSKPKTNKRRHAGVTEINFRKQMIIKNKRNKLKSK